MPLSTPSSVKLLPLGVGSLASEATHTLKMLREGVNVTLGTNGGSSNDDHDIICEMKYALLLQNVLNLDPRAISVEDVIEMATIRGARALGVERLIGSIEPGKRADIITIDYWQLHLMLLNNPLSHIVLLASGHDVRDVIIDGRAVMLNLKIITLKRGVSTY